MTDPTIDPRSVLFCIPSLAGKIDLDFSIAWDQTKALLMTNGIGHAVQVVRGDTFIDKARNRLVTHFLEDFPLAANLFFLDDDIGWPPEKVLEFLYRPEPILAGAYPMKTDEGAAQQYPLELAAKDGHLICRNGLYLANWAPTGFMRIKRAVLEQMAASADVYVEPEIGGTTGVRYSLFEAGAMQPDAGKDAEFWTSKAGSTHRVVPWRGEDIYFCDRWRAMGGEIWVDPTIHFSHRGGKKWEGSLIKDCAQRFIDHAPIKRRAIDIMEAAE
jgi:hypothetical protein